VKTPDIIAYAVSSFILQVCPRRIILFQILSFDTLTSCPTHFNILYSLYFTPYIKHGGNFHLLNTANIFLNKQEHK